MIIYKSTHEGKECRREIEAGGSIEEIIDDCCSLINHVYNSIKKASPKAAESMRAAFMLAMCFDPQFWAPPRPQTVRQEEVTKIEIKKEGGKNETKTGN